MKKTIFKHHLIKGVASFLVIAAAIVLYFLAQNFDSVRAYIDRINTILNPIYYGMVLAFLLLPVHRFSLKMLWQVTPNKYENSIPHKKCYNMLAVAISLIFAGIVVYVLLAMLLPQIYLSVIGLIQAVPEYIATFQIWLTRFVEDNPVLQDSVLYYYESMAVSLETWIAADILPNLESVNSIIIWIQSHVLPNITGVFTNVYGLLMAILITVKDVFIGVIVSAYLLARKDVFAAQTKKMTYSALSTKKADFVVGEVRNAYAILSGFIKGKLLDSLIIGVICLICCNLFGFPYPVLIATIIGVTNIIPFFGPFIGAIPCGMLILLVSPIQCLYFAVFILALQQFDGNILGPKILGDSTGLASFWVLFSILLAGGLFGFAGMVLGVPVFAMLYSMLNRLVRYGLTKRGLPVETAEYMGATAYLSGNDE